MAVKKSENFVVQCWNSVPISRLEGLNYRINPCISWRYGTYFSLWKCFRNLTKKSNDLFVWIQTCTSAKNYPEPVEITAQKNVKSQIVGQHGLYHCYKGMNLARSREHTRHSWVVAKLILVKAGVFWLRFRRAHLAILNSKESKKCIAFSPHWNLYKDAILKLFVVDVVRMLVRHVVPDF